MKTIAIAAICLLASSLGRATAGQVEPELIRSAQSGPWSSAATWKGDKVPGKGDRVQIRTGHRVTYDLNSAEQIRSIHIAGTMIFATDRDTRLEVGLIKIQPGTNASENGFDCDAHLPAVDPAGPRPTLEVGSPTQPIAATHKAIIGLVYFDGMDKESCPAIVCCGGRMEFHGTPMDRTWVKLGVNANARDTSIVLAEAVTGWLVGDHIIVTATAHDRGLVHAMRPNPDPDLKLDAPLTEERVIRFIDGNRLVLDKPLAHHHLGEGSYRGEVADLSRNVIVESADPSGVRGHTMYHRGSAGSISYAEFRHLGKKDLLGRYSLHFHLVRDTMRGSSVIGASIWDSDNRWLTIHGTDYLVVRDCVGYQSIGHGFYLEDGTETYNLLDHNLAVGAMAGDPLPKQSLPFDQNEGAGFWWANCLNSFTRNVACDCDRYGYRFEASPSAQLDLNLPIRQGDGSTKKVDIRTLPFIRFEDNEAHGAAYGLNLGSEGLERPGRTDRHSGVGPDERHPFVIRNTKIWNARWGIRPESPCLIVDGLDIYACVYGIYRGKFNRHAYSNLSMLEVGIPEAFSQGDWPFESAFPNSGQAAFNRVGAAYSGEEKEKFKRYLSSDVVEISPADAERFVRGSYNTGGKFDGKDLPRIIEDPTKAKGTGVTCGPCSSKNFPRPLDSVNDLPPATVITFVGKPDHGQVLVRGVVSSNNTVKRVRVNGQDAKSVANRFAEWEIALEVSSKGELNLIAEAEDAAGNVEKTPHRVQVMPVD